MPEKSLSEFESVCGRYRYRVEKALAERLFGESGSVEAEHCQRLHQAMRYSTLNGGKRLRAMLVYACGEALGARLEDLDTPASAVEMIHAYSLIHDDLPAMDNDELRRGRATCHIQFDQATAILAGDSLQTRAFEILSSSCWSDLDPQVKIALVSELAQASGSLGMAGGQALDMAATGNSINQEQLARLHRLKTGALIKASTVMGAMVGDVKNHKQLSLFRQYGEYLGLAFQIADDVLDATVDSHTLGKPSGADQRMNKSTYVSLLGLEEAKTQADNLSVQAIETLEPLGDNKGFLVQMAKFVVDRSY